MKKVNNLRLLYAGLFLVFLFSLLIMQFFILQVVQQSYWQKKARAQHVFVIEDPFRRGVFYSNSGLQPSHPAKVTPFVIDVQKFHLHADPYSIPDGKRQAVGELLVKHFDLTPEEVERHLSKRSRDRVLSRFLLKEQKEEFLSVWRPFARKEKIASNAIFFTSDYQRSYPYGSLLGQVLHTVQGQKHAVTGQAIPTGGLELSLNHYLEGQPGKRRMNRSPRNPLETGDPIVEPTHGADITLTINHTLQAIAEEEVKKGVIRTEAKSGWAILMDPKTGHIWALAQYPFFSPEEVSSFFSDPEKRQHTRVSAVIDSIEPGSVMKPFAILTGLLANEEMKARGKPPLFDPYEKIATADGKFPGRSKPIRDVRSYAYLNAEMGLLKSSNIYMGRVIERVVSHLGSDWYHNVLKERFAIGEKSGVELPGESNSLLPTPGKLHPNGKLEWSVPTPYSISMGYNIQQTGLALMRSWALFANRGILVQPTLVKTIDKQGERLLDHTSPEWLGSFPRVLPAGLVDQTVELMRYDTLIGTATRANIYGYTEIGKSGTTRKIVNGEYTTKKHYTSFIGFAPAKDPAFLLLVVIDEPRVYYIQGVGPNNHGGTAAAPVFREIGKRTLEYLGVSPDDPYGYPSSDPRFDPDLAKGWRSAERLREKFKAWNN